MALVTSRIPQRRAAPRDPAAARMGFFNSLFGPAERGPPVTWHAHTGRPDRPAIHSGRLAGTSATRWGGLPAADRSFPGRHPAGSAAPRRRSKAAGAGSFPRDRAPVLTRLRPDRGVAGSRRHLAHPGHPTATWIAFPDVQRAPCRGQTAAARRRLRPRVRDRSRRARSGIGSAGTPSSGGRRRPLDGRLGQGVGYAPRQPRCHGPVSAGAGDGA